MKTVFTGSETAHVWAQQTQQSGKNNGGSFYFEGKSIYSYGSHFEIARFIDDDHVLITSRGYSVTTSKHISWVRGAVSHKTVFIVPSFSNHKENVAYFIEQLKELSLKQKKARVWNYTDDIQKTKNNLEEYAKHFKVRLLKAQREILEAGIEEVVGKLLIAEKKESAKQKRLLSKRWSEWTGDKISYTKNEIYLRIVGDTVETSAGARVPVREGRILLDRIQKGKDVKGFKIGYYTVISLNGTLKIGCHQISRKEINRFAKFYKW